MSVLKAFVESPLAAAIGWALLHSLWQGAIISGALAAVLAAVRSARIRYAAAGIAMLLMLGGFALTLATVIPQRSQASLARGATTLQTVKLAATASSRPTNAGLAPLVPWLAPFWIAGASLIYLRRAASCISVQRLRRRGVCSAPEQWQERLAELSRRLRVSRPVQLLESSLAEAPAVLGHFCPLILMPLGLLAGLPPSQVEAILLHELAHVRRHDYLLNIFQRLAEGLFFYHPAIWWISRIMRAERENCCDDFAVAISGDSHEYASALAALEQRRQALVEPALAATGGSLVKRIRRVLYPATSTAPWVPFLAATVFIIAAAVSLAAWQAESPRTDAPPQSQTEASSRYSKWLNEDVVYIITGEERAAFLQLSTDEDRDKFIEQFWLTRDPSPGTPTNEFKEEHYRRIAYANAHFGTPSGTPGWQTDRGRIYIIYGRPEELEVHPVGTRPYEVWRYQHDGGSFTFVDQTGRGDFRLAPGTTAGSRRSRIGGRYTKEPSTPPPPPPVEKPPAPVRGTTTDGERLQRIRVSEGVMEELVLEKVPPVYPKIAEQARIQGTVLLKAVIGHDGLVQELHVISGHPMLVQPAMEAARRWRFRPYLLNGAPVEVETVIRIPFDLSETTSAANQPGPPEMSCTYWDTDNKAHDGLCEASELRQDEYFCRQTDGDKLAQHQTGCEWKVKRFQEWQRQQRQAK